MPLIRERLRSNREGQASIRLVFVWLTGEKYADQRFQDLLSHARLCYRKKMRRCSGNARTGQSIDASPGMGTRELDLEGTFLIDERFVPV